MEDIISKLAEIEAAASHIMDDVAEQKKQLAREYEESIQNFDDTIDREVQEKSETIRRELEVRMKDELAKQRSETETVLSQMESYYETHHSQLAKQIYDKILQDVILWEVCFHTAVCPRKSVPCRVNSSGKASIRRFPRWTPLPRWLPI